MAVFGRESGDRADQQPDAEPEDQQPRDWRTLLGAFIQTGRGLAAAHAMGIVHGDFKPDNVLVGADGRIRVVDFGLAHLVAAHGGEADGAAGEDGRE